MSSPTVDQSSSGTSPAAAEEVVAKPEPETSFKANSVTAPNSTPDESPGIKEISGPAPERAKQDAVSEAGVLKEKAAEPTGPQPVPQIKIEEVETDPIPMPESKPDPVPVSRKSTQAPSSRRPSVAIVISQGDDDPEPIVVKVGQPGEEADVADQVRHRSTLATQSRPSVTSIRTAKTLVEPVAEVDVPTKIIKTRNDDCSEVLVVEEDKHPLKTYCAMIIDKIRNLIWPKWHLRAALGGKAASAVKPILKEAAAEPRKASTT